MKAAELRKKISVLRAEINHLNRREGIFRKAMGRHCGSESTVMSIAGLVWDVETYEEALRQIRKIIAEGSGGDKAAVVGIKSAVVEAKNILVEIKNILKDLGIE